MEGLSLAPAGATLTRGTPRHSNLSISRRQSVGKTETVTPCSGHGGGRPEYQEGGRRLGDHHRSSLPPRRPQGEIWPADLVSGSCQPGSQRGERPLAARPTPSAGLRPPAPATAQCQPPPLPNPQPLLTFSSLPSVNVLPVLFLDIPPRFPGPRGQPRVR